MRNIKRLVVLLAIFLFLGGYVYAQEQSDALAQSNTKTQSTAPEQPGVQQQSSASVRKSPTSNDVVQKMKTDLNLTQEQVETIKPIIEQNMAKRKELLDKLKQQGANEDSIRTQMEQLNQERDQQLSKILSQDQMDKLKDIKTEKHHKGKKKHGVGNRAGRLD